MDKSSFRSRWNAKAEPLLLAAFIVLYVLRPVKKAVDWLVQDHPRLSPLAATAFEGGILVIVVPLVLAALIHGRSKGLMRFFAQVRAFWMRGARLGLACLLLLAPGIICWQVLEYFSALGIFNFTSRYGIWLAILAWAVYLLGAPFWASPFLGSFYAALQGSAEPSREEDRAREGFVKGVSG